jgi:phosphate transport system substrate-binding protein
MKLLKLLPLLFLAASSITSCQDRDKNGKVLDTPTAGEINIGVDETLYPIADAELDAFHHTYTNAKVNASYKPEAETITDFLKDSSRLIVITRELTAEEKKVFEAKKINITVTRIAYDAIALITNNENPVKKFSYAQMQDIFTGKIKNWKELDKTYPDMPLQIVFDNKNSATFRAIRDQFNLQNQLPSTFFALEKNIEVIEHVNKNKSALGLIGVSWISDSDDSTANDFLNQIKVTALSPPDTAKGAGEAYEPFQAYIAQKFYPLRRSIYIISSEARSGLGTGFTAFVAGNKGQSIILKAGLVPATMPVRLVEIKNK